MQYKEDDEIISIFLEETKDHLIILENGIIELENKITKTKQSLIESLFRAAHSIKAAANLLKLKNVESISHELENILDMGRQDNLIMDSNIVNGFLKGVDTIKEMLEFRQFSDDINISAMLQMLKNLRK
jgi:chemotaxis protein histidine kinase CheA